MMHLSFNSALDSWERGDISSAINIWQSLANSGDVRSQYNLGVLYEQGSAVEKNLWEAFHWFSLAAAQGFADAQFNCALMLFDGEGCARNPSAAIEWLQKAASAGHTDSMFNLGQMYAAGEIVEQDWDHSFRLLKASANKGHALAANNLAIRYAMGQGTSRSDYNAYVWFSIAALSGDAGAVRHRERVASQISADDIVRAGKESEVILKTIRRQC